MQKAGAYLKSIREDKGYTIQEISKATKLSCAVIRALEEGRIDNVDPVYLKGFLKLYCRYLGLDWGDFISQHPIPVLAKGAQKSSSSKSQARDKKTVEANSSGNRKPDYGLVANSSGNRKPDYGLVAKDKKEGISFLKLVQVNKKIIALILTVIAVLLFTFIVFRGCVFLFKKLPKFELPKVKSVKVEKPKAPEPIKVIKAAPPKKIPAPPPAKVSAPVAKEPVNSSGNRKPDYGLAAKEPPVKDSPKALKPKEVTLAIRAQDDSFITLKVDGKIVYQRMMYKGKAETWSAKNKIEFSVGNAGGLSLEVNGKPILPLGKKGQQIKNILINSEGLKAL